MIVEAEYDDGSPYYIEVLGRWTQPREPVWRFKCRCSTVAGYEEIADWLETSSSGYDYTYRFNDGDSYLAVELIYNEDAIAFRLRFG